ncbi:unnamed protein product [Scytosiphon promiscuus]
MAWSHGFLRFAGRGGSAALLAAVGAVLLGGASAQDSCVQVSNASFASSCPCDAGSTLSFGIEGQTTVTANTVNVAIVLDGSGSISSDNFNLSQAFAKDTVAAFADENLFDNGGTASFTQFSSFATPGGTFSSQGDFDAFVDAELQLSGGTDIPSGIARGSELLAAAPNASASFMVVLTDGVGGDPTVEANAARAAGTIVYAVGVGPGPDQATLLAIAGNESNIFDVDDFTLLDTALEGIISNSAGSVPCAATGAIISLVFNAAVAGASVGDGSGTATISADGSTVIFELSGTLEATPTDFSVVLDVCEGAPGDEVVSVVTYTDDEGNMPDLSALEGNYATVPTCREWVGGGFLVVRVGEGGEGGGVHEVWPLVAGGSGVQACAYVREMDTRRDSSADVLLRIGRPVAVYIQQPVRSHPRVCTIGCCPVGTPVPAPGECCGVPGSLPQLSLLLMFAFAAR